MAPAERDRRLRGVVFGALLLAMPVLTLQFIYAELLTDGVKRLACDVEQSAGHFTTPARTAVVLALAATAAVWSRPRWSAALLAASALASLVFAARDGWAAGGCAFGV